ncbi:unnamed protein product [Symbiodinium necroappetens]|uniref:PPPDE domain-containing protein n=1 Tax=Symbiodinium necroappetens TaxID=1628268 RepID=A0A812QL62_9DINO|nr:unnamed protein product [Symbiodinium necroappetens]
MRKQRLSPEAYKGFLSMASVPIGKQPPDQWRSEGNTRERGQRGVDVLSRLTLEELQQLVTSPPVLDEGDYQAKLTLLSPSRVPLASSGPIHPQWVQVHVYNLSENFVGANQMLAFAESGPALGGAFHVGVEVFGAEWSYGVYGIACDPPRSETAHVYECSVYVGVPWAVNEVKSQMEVADILHTLCQEWRGQDYDVLSDRLQKVVLEDVPVLYRVARPHVERAIVQTQVYVVEKGTEAGKVIHKAVVHDVPVMVETGVETARPYVQQAGQAIHKAVWHDVPVMYETARPYVEEAARAAHRAVAEEAPKAIEAVRPHVERAVTNAWHHTSSAVQTAGDVISQHAQTAAANVAIAAEAVQEQLFGSASSSSKSSRSSSPSPAIPEAAPETRKPEPPTRSETTVQVLTAPIEPGFRRKADAILSTTSAADAVADRVPSQGAADGPADAHACPSRPGGVRDASTGLMAASDKAIPLTPDGHAAPTYKKLTAP